MALIASDVFGHIKHALSGEPAPEVSMRSIANHAGEWLFSAQPWKFLERPPARLDLRGTIIITAATWTAATKTLTATAPATAFLNYVQLDGDEFKLTSGTGATLDYYPIVSRTSSTAVILSQDIGAADGTANIAGTMELPACALPTDFASLEAIVASVGFTVTPVSHRELIEMRLAVQVMQSGSYVYAITSAADPLGQDAPSYRLDIYPTPTANSSNYFTIAYRSGWVRLANENEKLQMPSWIEALYLETARTFALGWEEADKEPLDSRLARLRVGALWQVASQRDGSVLFNHGEMRGGAATRVNGGLEMRRFTLNAPG